MPSSVRISADDLFTNDADQERGALTERYGRRCGR
jgi:hypothetical protein